MTKASLKKGLLYILTIVSISSCVEDSVYDFTINNKMIQSSLTEPTLDKFYVEVNLNDTVTFMDVSSSSDKIKNRFWDLDDDGEWDKDFSDKKGFQTNFDEPGMQKIVLAVNEQGNKVTKWIKVKGAGRVAVVSTNPKLNFDTPERSEDRTYDLQIELEDFYEEDGDQVNIFFNNDPLKIKIKDGIIEEKLRLEESDNTLVIEVVVDDVVVVTEERVIKYGEQEIEEEYIEPYVDDYADNLGDNSSNGDNDLLASNGEQAIENNEIDDIPVTNPQVIESEVKDQEVKNQEVKDQEVKNQGVQEPEVIEQELNVAKIDDPVSKDPVVNDPADPPKAWENKAAKMSFLNLDIANCEEILTNSFSVKIIPNRKIELKDIIVIAEMKGAVKIKLSSSEGTDEITSTLTQGKCQIDLLFLNTELNAGVEYTLMMTSHVSSSDSTVLPSFVNISNCSGSPKDTDHFKVKGSGKTIAYEILYTY